MIAGERFQAVTGTFGRPRVETFVLLAAAFGQARSARYVRRTDEFLPQEAELAASKDEEMHIATQAARADATFAAVAALDVTGWRIARFILSAAEMPETSANATDYEIAYLARPTA